MSLQVEPSRSVCERLEALERKVALLARLSVIDISQVVDVVKNGSVQDVEALMGLPISNWSLDETMMYAAGASRIPVMEAVWAAVGGDAGKLCVERVSAFAVHDGNADAIEWLRGRGLFDETAAARFSRDKCISGNWPTA